MERRHPGRGAGPLPDPMPHTRGQRLADSALDCLTRGLVMPGRPRRRGEAPEALDRSVAAAVLIPLIARPEGVQVLLTRRADHLKDHAGQVSFPGGRMEPEDEDPLETALREAYEEVGLPPHRVRVLGGLAPCRTGSGFVVTPVVGVIQAPFDPVLDPREVAQAFEVPLAFLLDPVNHQQHALTLPDGRAHAGFAMTYERWFIWGATATMIRTLYEVVSSS